MEDVVYIVLWKDDGQQMSSVHNTLEGAYKHIFGGLSLLDGNFTDVQIVRGNVVLVRETL